MWAVSFETTGLAHSSALTVPIDSYALSSKYWLTRKLKQCPAVIKALPLNFVTKAMFVLKSQNQWTDKETGVEKKFEPNQV